MEVSEIQQNSTTLFRTIYLRMLESFPAFLSLSGTGIRQISHRFKSQTGLLLFSLITDIFGSLSRSVSLSNTHPLKADLITLFCNQV